MHSPFQTVERAQVPETKLLREFPPQRRRVLQAENSPLFSVFCYELASYQVPAELSSAAHRSACSAEQRRAVPRTAVRCGCRAVRYCSALCSAVPCCVLCCTFSVVHARFHSTKYHTAVPRYAAPSLYVLHCCITKNALPAQLSSATAQQRAAQRRAVPYSAVPCPAMRCCAELRRAFFRTHSTRYHAKCTITRYRYI